VHLRWASLDDGSCFNQEVAMTGYAKRALVLAALGVVALTSPASARTSAPADVGAQCRAQVNGLWDPSHRDYERHRDMLLSACLNNGGTVPGSIQ
jgi:hypothetical protein